MANTPKHRENLVNSAVRLFRRQGYAGTGLQQILAESGAPKGSLYHYFPGGKEAIGEAAVRRASQQVAEMLAGIAAAHDTAADFVRAWFAQYAAWMEESAYASGCPIATTLLETTPLSGDITRAGREGFDQWVAIIAPVFSAPDRPQAEAEKWARFAIATLEGALILARVEQSSAPILDAGARVGRVLESESRLE